MMKTLKLDVGDMIQIKTTSLELAKLVKLQPQSVKFLEVSDPRAVLENAFRNFAAVTKGDVFAFEYNGEIYEMAVLDVKPETPKMGVSMIETDVSVDFAPPVGYVEPSVQKPTSRAGSGTSTPRSVRGGGLPAGGLLHSQGTMAQAINYDAIAPGAVNAAAAAGHFFGEGNRLAPSKKGSKTATPSNKPATPVPTEIAAVPPRRRNGPMPLRLGPNRLFFGYEIIPVKTAADKEAELQAAKQPHFAGQGQTLRGGVKKEGDGDKDKGKGPETKQSAEAPKGRRLDGRAV
jgi:ubiquitin fusion degradation protein 1